MRRRSTPDVPRPALALTIGDAAGIGPEIAVTAALDEAVRAICEPILVGDRDSVQRALAALGRGAAISDRAGPGALHLEEIAAAAAPVAWGAVQATAGSIGWQAVERATAMAIAGRVAGIVTAPLNKEALVAAGAPSIDHTTGLARLTGASDVLTLFVAGRLRIVFATRHTSLRNACDELTRERLVQVLTACDAWLRDQGVAGARFAVAALNPHAGEGGLFGREEIDVIAPAIETARGLGVIVDGPVAADSVFHQCLQGRSDVVVSLYHDQGHIAAKTYDFERTVAVTTGLPFIRTSVDHGTAYDLAGTGRASAVSMIEAVKVAVDLVHGRWGSA